MTNPDIAALSAAATQGEWQVAAWYHNSGTPDERCGGFIEADDSPTGVIDENWMQSSESLSRDLDFIAALVNAYRSGNLVQIDREGMRERATTLVDAIENAGRGYSINLVRLVDGVSTYELKYRGQTTEHESYEEAHETLRASARQEKIDAAIAAILGGEA